MLTGPSWAPNFGARYGKKTFKHALTVTKFVFSNFRAKANPRKPGLALKGHSGNDWGPIPVLTGNRLECTRGRP